MTCTLRRSHRSQLSAPPTLARSRSLSSCLLLRPDLPPVSNWSDPCGTSRPRIRPSCRTWLLIRRLAIGDAGTLAAVIDLLTLKQEDPAAAAAIEALPWVQDGIGNAFPSERGFAFELSRLQDLIDLARRSRQTFNALLSKPWILNDFAPFPQTAAVRGVAGDLWADVIIGQPDFSQISDDQVVPFKLFNSGGVLVDRSVAPGRLYVWDAGNSRILGVDLATCYAGPGPCVPDVVLGQPSGFDHAACNGDSNVQGLSVSCCGQRRNSLRHPRRGDFAGRGTTQPRDDGAGCRCGFNLYVPDFLEQSHPEVQAPVRDRHHCRRSVGTERLYRHCLQPGQPGLRAHAERFSLPAILGFAVSRWWIRQRGGD